MHDTIKTIAATFLIGALLGATAMAARTVGLPTIDDEPVWTSPFFNLDGEPVWYPTPAPRD